MFFPGDAIVGFLLRPVFRALEQWAERVRQSQPLEPSAARLIWERAAQETSRWANSHAIAFALIAAPLTGGIATLSAILASDWSIAVQVIVSALGGVIGLVFSVAGIALCFLLKAVPTVREERRTTQEATQRALVEMEERLARPQKAHAEIQAHQERLSNLLAQVENAQKYPKPHRLAEPINKEFHSIRRTFDEYNLAVDRKTFQVTASESMELNELAQMVASGKGELADISFSIRLLFPMLET